LGDVDGAANRAYYAMFDAARAALIASNAPVSVEVSRTHSGLIAAFGNHLVKTGPLTKEIGRLFNRAHEIRLIADYNGPSVTFGDASQLVDEAKLFVQTIQISFDLGSGNLD
jgi:uncharacterized protein (UPF0332 family)